MQPIVRIKPKAPRASQPSSISFFPTTDPEEEKKTISLRTLQGISNIHSFQKVFSLEEWKQGDIIEWRSLGNPFLKTNAKRSKKPWWHFALSIVGAIALGSAMGLSVLQFFFDHTKETSSTPTASRLTPVKMGEENRKRSASLVSSNVQNKANPPKFSLPSLRMVLIQTGNYQKKEEARRMAQSYRTKGLASLVSERAPYKIYLGLGGTRDDSLKLNQVVRQQEVEVFLKEMEVGAKGLTKKEEGISRDLIASIQLGHRLFQELAVLTAEVMPIDGSQIGSFAQGKEYSIRYQEFVAKTKGLGPRLSKKSQHALAGMTKAVDQMVISAIEAQKATNPALLWQIQEGLLRYAFGYEKLIQSFK